MKKLVKTIDSTHTGNIFNAKFLPFTNDNEIISCALDSVIKYINIEKDTIHSFTSHDSMVKKLEIDPQNPKTFISCSQGSINFKNRWNSEII